MKAPVAELHLRSQELFLQMGFGHPSIVRSLPSVVRETTPTARSFNDSA